VETLTALPTLSAVALVGLAARMLWVAVADELTAMSKQQRAAQTVRLWNLSHPIGTTVVLDPQKDAKHTHTTSTAWVLCGEPVISVAGECGSVALARVVVAEEFKEKKLKHTKEPWEVDHRECDGVRYFVMLGPDGKTIMDTMNSESQLIEEDFDEDGFRDQWDEQGKLDLKRASVCVTHCKGIADPSAIPTAVGFLQVLANRDLSQCDAHTRAGLLVDLHAQAARILAKLKGGA